MVNDKLVNRYIEMYGQTGGKKDLTFTRGVKYSEKSEKYLDRLGKYAKDNNSSIDLAICTLIKPRLLKEDNDTPPLDSCILWCTSR